MKYLRIILQKLNSSTDLSKKDVIEKMLNALKANNPNLKLSGVNDRFTLEVTNRDALLSEEEATFEDCTLLHVAALFNCHRLAKLLIEKGADLNSKDARGRTPLHYATMHGSRKVTKVLVNEGADVYSQDFLEKTPLYYEFTSKYLYTERPLTYSPKTAKLLLNKGADQSYIRTMNPNKANKPFAIICKFTAAIGVVVALGLAWYMLPRILFADPYILEVLLLTFVTIASMIVGASVICGAVCGTMYMLAKRAFSSTLKVTEILVNKKADIYSQDLDQKNPSYSESTDKYPKTSRLSMNPDKANKPFATICKFTGAIGVMMTLGFWWKFLPFNEPYMNDPYVIGTVFLTFVTIASMIVSASVICGAVCGTMYMLAKRTFSSKLDEVSCDATFLSQQPANG